MTFDEHDEVVVEVRLDREAVKRLRTATIVRRLARAGDGGIIEALARRVVAAVDEGAEAHLVIGRNK